MERFLRTKFLLFVRDREDDFLIDGQYIYSEFVNLLFTEKAVMDNNEYHNALVHTYVELECLTQVSGEKCGKLSA
jgi:hypothetical protein